jgi:rSAM/selenodomain-associated transferase 2
VAERAHRLSVIVPTLNEAGLIVMTLAALAVLRARGAQVIVVDGGSIDDTMRLAAPLADQVLECRRGRAHQMNHGAAAASGDVLLFLHADTTLPRRADDLILDGLGKARRRWGYFSVAIDGRHAMLTVVAALMNLRSRLSAIATGDQALFVARSEFEAIGGFPAQPLMEDIELARRLKRRSRPLCLTSKVTTSGRRWMTQGVWRTIGLMWRLRLLYWLGVPAEKLRRAYP